MIKNNWIFIPPKIPSSSFKDSLNKYTYNSILCEIETPSQNHQGKNLYEKHRRLNYTIYAILNSKYSSFPIRNWWTMVEEIEKDRGDIPPPSFVSSRYAMLN